MERAANTITEVAAGKKIDQVETTEDTIVYAGTTHEEFVSIITNVQLVDFAHPIHYFQADEIRGRTLRKAVRYGL